MNERSCVDEECLCPAKGIIETVSKKWAICIVSLLNPNVEGLRFNQLKRTLDISPKSLSDTLEELDTTGIVHREVGDGKPPGVTYSLTQDGEDLAKTLEPLVKWVKEREEK